ncbi:MAG: hypothetical protein GF334_01510 [Candidatus Altiarchaeales archaeon]|nr:hypothetical protein [Candidatus Altiarchaeales archaeon]
MAKIERRDGTSTEGRGLGHSFAADNVDRGDPELNQFIKRRPTYPWGDNPRGREIEFQDQSQPKERETFRAYRGLVPIEGQDPLKPKQVIRVGSIKEIRPELPNRTVDTAALDAAKEAERQALLAADFGSLFPSAEILSPSPGATFSPGDRITIRAKGTDIRGIYSCTLFVDGSPVDRRNLDRRDQDHNKKQEFIFLYDVPADRALGSMDIMIRVFDVESSAQGVIADDAINDSPVQFRGAVGSQDGRIGRTGSTPKTNPQLEIDPHQYLRTPEGIATITVNIV